MDFKEYIKTQINEEEDFSVDDFGNATSVFENLSEVVSRLADFFQVVSTKGNLFASGDSKRALIDIRTLVNTVKNSCDNKDKIFTDEELTAMRRISEGLRDVTGKKLVSLSKNIKERQKKEEDKAAKKVEPAPEPDETAEEV